jgi:hypothetical protein
MYVQLRRSTTDHGTCHMSTAVLVNGLLTDAAFFTPLPCSQLGCGGSTSSARPALHAPMHVIGHAPPYTRQATVFTATGHTWRAHPSSLAYLSGTLCSSSLPSRIPYLKNMHPPRAGRSRTHAAGRHLSHPTIPARGLGASERSGACQWHGSAPAAVNVGRGIGALGTSLEAIQILPQLLQVGTSTLQQG